MTAKPVLAVMARWPSAGRCKKRLANDLSRLPLNHAGMRAARLQQRLMDHTMAVAMSLRQQGHVELALAVSGLAPRAARRWGHSVQADRTVLQRGGSLGCRLRHLLLAFQRSNQGRSVLVIGTDLPELNRHDLLVAVESLQHRELVLGPADDGGYWLIGLSSKLLTRPACWPFSGIPWGGSAVLESTLHFCQQAQLKTGLLPLRDDIDHLRDLKPWLSF